MCVTVYGYQIEQGRGEVNGFSSSIEETERLLFATCKEIELEDGWKIEASAIYAFDMALPSLEQMFAVLNGEADIRDLVLREMRLVRSVIHRGATLD
jgi:hypothetical protein